MPSKAAQERDEWQRAEVAQGRLAVATARARARSRAAEAPTPPAGPPAPVALPPNPWARVPLTDARGRPLSFAEREEWLRIAESEDDANAQAQARIAAARQP